MKIVHLTDLHLGRSSETIYGLDVESRVEQAFRRVARRHGDAALCLITGDLAHRGDRDAYRTLRGLLPILPMPVVLGMGNHDDRDMAREELPGLDWTPDGFVQRDLDLGQGWRLLMIDTNDGANSLLGRLCARRLDWIESRLAASPGVRWIVAMHHPPCRVGLPGLDPHVTIGGDRLLAMLRAAGGGHICYGHHHRPTFAALPGGVSLSTVPAIAFQFALALDRPEVLGTDEPAAAGIVLPGPEGVIVHLDHLESDPPRFSLGVANAALSYAAVRYQDA